MFMYPTLNNKQYSQSASLRFFLVVLGLQSDNRKVEGNN